MLTNIPKLILMFCLCLSSILFAEQSQCDGLEYHSLIGQITNDTKTVSFFNGTIETPNSEMRNFEVKCHQVS